MIPTHHTSDEGIVMHPGDAYWVLAQFKDILSYTNIGTYKCMWSILIPWCILILGKKDEIVSL